MRVVIYNAACDTGDPQKLAMGLRVESALVRYRLHGLQEKLTFLPKRSRGFAEISKQRVLNGGERQVDFDLEEMQFILAR